MADWIPILSQAKSFVQWAAGDSEGARKTQVNFTRQCPGVSQVRTLGEIICGDLEAASQTQEEFWQNTSGVMDSVPILGHIKGTVHYMVGDKEGGDNAMKSASRTAGTVAGGAVGMVIGGPPGAIAGGMTGGLAMDSITTAVDSEIHGEKRLSGVLKQIDDYQANPEDVGKFVDICISLAGDGAVGYATGKWLEKNGKRNQFQSNKSRIIKDIGPAAANDMIKSATQLEYIRQASDIASLSIPQVSSLVRDLTTDKTYEGHNKQVRDSINKTKTADTPSNLEKRFPNVKPPLNRPASTCAEQQAYHSYYKENPKGDPKNTRVSTVRYDKNTNKIRAVRRCDNCMAYAEGMGEAPGDSIHDEFVPTDPGSINKEVIGAFICASCLEKKVSVGKKIPRNNALVQNKSKSKCKQRVVFESCVEKSEEIVTCSTRMSVRSRIAVFESRSVVSQCNY